MEVLQEVSFHKPASAPPCAQGIDMGDASPGKGEITKLKLPLCMAAIVGPDADRV